MTTEVTTAARRIARAHNACGGNLIGGILAFRPDGTGGEWYSYGSRLPADAVQVTVRFGRLSEREAQEILDDSIENMAHRDADAREDTDLPPAVPQPCNDCPWRKNATPGWLGPYSAKRWLRAAHGESAVACHETIKRNESWEGARQCAGLGSFRANVCKSPRDPRVVQGPPRDDVFGSNQEFLDHHAPGEVWVPSDMWDFEDEDDE